MKRLFLLVLLGLGLTACAPSVVRDKNVYESEVKLFSQISKQAGELLAAEMATKCVCEEKVFMDPWCEKSAQVVLVTQVRVPWHTDMMLYLGGISETHPGDEPAFPALSTLCAKTSTVTEKK